MSEAEENVNFDVRSYRDIDGTEYYQVTVSCKCGRGGWVRIPKDTSDPDLKEQ